MTFLYKKKDFPNRKFEFEFRYYTPYHEGVLKKSGIYVFKTSDKDSTPYNHTIASIEVFKGKAIQTLNINYKNQNDPMSQVKIKVPRNSDTIEFDTFFARLSPSTFGQDVTINWRSLDYENSGEWYSDVNAYKIMHREKEPHKDYPVN